MRYNFFRTVTYLFPAGDIWKGLNSCLSWIAALLYLYWNKHYASRLRSMSECGSQSYQIFFVENVSLNFRTLRSVSTELCTKHFSLKGNYVCSVEVPSLFLHVDWKKIFRQHKKSNSPICSVKNVHICFYAKYFS